MKKFLPPLLRHLLVYLSIFIIFLLIAAPLHHTFAYVAGGAGKMTLNPTAATMTINQQNGVDINLNTGNVAVSTFQLRLTFTASGLDTVAVQPNTTLGWSFLTNQVSTANGTTTIDLSGAYINTNGYTNNAYTKFATIQFKPTSSFTTKSVNFDSGLSKMFRKSDGADILGTLGNGAYSTTGVAPTPTPTPTPASNPTATPTPTPTITQQSGTNTVPTCTGLTANPSSGNAPALVVTLTCSGIDSDGYINGASFVFGDGTTQSVQKNVGSPGSVSITHTYTQIGTVAATCAVEDNNHVLSGATDACRQLVMLRSAGSGGTYVNVTPATTVAPTATPTPETVEALIDTPIPEETPLPIESPVSPTTTTSGFPWWLIGTLGLIGLGALIYILSKRTQRPPTSPPWMTPPSMPQQPPPPTDMSQPPTQPPTAPPPTV